MTDGPIDVVINDKISPAIEGKLDRIGSKAKVAHSAVERLKAAIASTNIAGLDRVTATNAKLNLMAQQQQAATAKLAIATARLATEQNRTAIAAARLAKENSNAAAAAIRLQQAQNRASSAVKKTADDAERLKRELFPLYDAQQRFNSAMDRANGLLQAGAIDEKTYAAAVLQSKNALLQSTQAVNGYTAAQNRMGKGAQINRMHLNNLGFQLNDIGVSLASGQNPLIVLVQQGSQIAGIASQAGVGLGRLGLEAAKMMARFVPIIAVLGAVVAGFKMIANQAERNEELEAYARSLGATREEIKRLNLDSVTFGDTMRGLWKTIDDASGISTVFSKIGAAVKYVFVGILNIIGTAITSIVALFQAAYDTIFKRANFVDAYTTHLAANQAKVLGFLDTWEKNSADAAKKRIALQLEDEKAAESRATTLRKINAELDNELSRMFMVGAERERQQKLDSIEEQLLGKKITLHAKERAEIEAKVDALTRQAGIARAYTSAIETAVGPAKAYADALGAQAMNANASAVAQQQLERQVNMTKQAYEDSLDPLAELKRGIQEEISLATTRADFREREQLAQQARNDLEAKGIALNDTLNNQIYDLIDARTEALIIQEREDAIFDLTLGKQQAYIRNLEMLEELKRRAGGGVAAQEIIRGNPELDFSGTQLEEDARYERERELYARIEDLRQRDLISEQDAHAARFRIWAEGQKQRLSTASTFFEGLSQLQNSNSKKLARIGKAAAIANTIIKTYESATSAYSAMAGIPYVGPALGVAAAAAAIAGGMANVAAIRAQEAAPGFATGGSYTVGGTGGVDSQMVNFRATPGERININTPAQAKALEKGGSPNITFINQGTPKVFETQVTRDEIRIISRDVAEEVVAEKAPGVVAADMANPNSKTSKSLARNTNASRKR
jgi:hypothetical protein